MTTEKFAENLRTFETRLLFISDIFSSVYSKDEIMTSCIEYKLSSSLQVYDTQLKRDVALLEQKDPLKILGKLK